MIIFPCLHSANATVMRCNIFEVLYHQGLECNSTPYIFLTCDHHIDKLTVLPTDNDIHISGHSNGNF